ncbi:MAG: hypothetical protein ACR2KX_11665 [Chitinophagaceae bacterium]
MKKKSAKKSDIIMQPVLMPAMPGMIGMEGLAPNVMWVPVKKTSIKKLASKKAPAKKVISKKPASPKTTRKNVSGKSKK